MTNSWILNKSVNLSMESPARFGLHFGLKVVGQTVNLFWTFYTFNNSSPQTGPSAQKAEEGKFYLVQIHARMSVRCWEGTHSSCSMVSASCRSRPSTKGQDADLTKKNTLFEKTTPTIWTVLLEWLVWIWSCSALGKLPPLRSPEWWCYWKNDDFLNYYYY